MGFLRGKPLYLDAQATTPLVSIIDIIDFKIIFRHGYLICKIYLKCIWK